MYCEMVVLLCSNPLKNIANPNASLLGVMTVCAVRKAKPIEEQNSSYFLTEEGNFDFTFAPGGERSMCLPGVR